MMKGWMYFSCMMKFILKDCYYLVWLVFFVLCWLFSGMWGTFSLFFLVESNLSYIMILLVLMIYSSYFLCFIVSKKSYSFIFYIYLIILVLFFSCNSIVGFYLLFEMAVLPMYVIILGWGDQPERLMASNYLLLYTLFFSVPFLTLLVYMCWNISAYWDGISSKSCSTLCWMLLMSPFFVKVPVYGVHLWLPKAHVEAPALGSMLLASLLLKTGGYGMLKFSGMRAWFCSGKVMSFMIILVLFSAFMCLIQVDLKKFVAYSSVTYMTMMVSLLFSKSYLLDSLMLVLMIMHGVISNAMFYIANFMSGASKIRLIYCQYNMGHQMPWVWYIILVLLLLNAGFPPSLNMCVEFFFLVITSLCWGGNGLLNLILFMALMYYPMWFITNLSSSKIYFTGVSLVKIFDLTMFVCLPMYFLIFWFNMDILL